MLTPVTGPPPPVYTWTVTEPDGTTTSYPALMEANRHRRRTPGATIAAITTQED